MMKRLLCGLVLLLFISSTSWALSVLPRESSALYGMTTTAGEGATRGSGNPYVCRVVNTNDDGDGSDDGVDTTGYDVSGSFRYCAEEVSSPKTIIFETSGWIDLSYPGIQLGGASGTDADTKGSYTTIAGQTAPSPGIGFKSFGITIARNVNDVLIQHITIREGDDQLWDKQTGWSVYAGTTYEDSYGSTYLGKVTYDGTTLALGSDEDNLTNNQYYFDNPGNKLYVEVGEDPDLGELVTSTTKSNTFDPITVEGNYDAGVWVPATNIVIDHISTSWGSDMNMQIQGDNITIINSIISEALHNLYHSKDEHSKGLYVSNDASTSAQNVAVVRNIFAHNDDRNPMFEFNATGIVVNNIMYDINFSFVTSDDSTNPLYVSYVGNYQLETDLTTQGAPYIKLGRNAASRVFLGPDNYFSGAVQTTPWDVEATTDIDLRTEGGDGTDPPEINRAATKEDAYWPVGYDAMASAAAARTYVLANAGSRPADRSVADAGIITDVEGESGTGAFVQTIVGANTDCYEPNGPWDCCSGDEAGTCPDTTWETLAENTQTHTLPASPHTVAANGYTNLENWLHGINDIVEGRTTRLGSGANVSIGSGATAVPY